MSGRGFALIGDVSDARARAKTLTPPVLEAPEGGWLRDDLVDVRAIDASIRVDVKYATADNFMGEAIYDAAVAALQRPVAEDLQRAHSQLKTQGFGLLVWDAYRPWWATWVMWEVSPAWVREDFLADPARGSIHNRGGAVDVGLYHLASGEPVTMPSAFDEFSERAAYDFAGGDASAREHRDLLIATMRDHGFNVYRLEWWHFNHRDARRYALNNTPLADLLPETDEAARRPRTEPTR